MTFKTCKNFFWKIFVSKPNRQIVEGLYNSIPLKIQTQYFGPGLLFFFDTSQRKVNRLSGPFSFEMLYKASRRRTWYILNRMFSSMSKE